MTVLHSAQEPSDTAAQPRSRTPGAWAIVLFAGFAAVTFAFLYISREVEDLQTQILDYVKDRTDASVSIGSARIAGFRSIRFEDVSLSYETENGVRIETAAPSVAAVINPLAWLEREQIVSNFDLRDAVVTVDLSAREHDPENPYTDAWLDRLPANVTLSDCTLVVLGLREGSAVELDGIRGQVVRGEERQGISAEIEGNFDRASEKLVVGRIQYAKLDDFKCELRVGALTAMDVNAFLPEEHHFAESGRVTPSIRITAYPDETLAIALDSEFQDITVRNQPEFLGVIEGSIEAVARYDKSSRRLAVQSAALQSNELRANLTGSLEFAGEQHGIDLQLEATELPLKSALDYYLPDEIRQHGEIEVEFEQPEQFSASIAGTAEAYRISATGRAPGARVTFKPNDDRFPEGHLELSGIEAGWDSETESPTLSATIRDGAVRHEETGVDADRLSGMVNLVNNTLTVDPLNAEIFSEPFVARANYSLDDETGSVSVSGTLRHAEDTALATAIMHTDIAGALKLDAEATYANGKVTLDGEVEATNAQVDYNWWFSKPAGIGAKATANIQYDPESSILIVAHGDVANTALEAQVDIARVGDKWRALKAVVSAPETLDIVSAGKCFRMPYTITGSTARNASYEWTRIGKDGVLWEGILKGDVEQIELFPDEGTEPIEIWDASVHTLMTKSDDSTGELTVRAAKAAMPQFGAVWFRPLRQDEALLERFPPVPRRWRYTLHADALSAPPWSGTDFDAITTRDGDRVILESYTAKVGDGSVKGAFRSYRAENRYETELEWDGVPAEYFLAHLQMPEVLAGPIRGKVSYGMDRDDPGTLAGGGEFTIEGGQFSADFIINLLERQMEGDMSSLPPSLKFDRLHADVEFERDVVKTPVVELVAEGLHVDGKGQYVRDGDMDYTLEVKISPETAEQIPALRDSLNLEGYKLAQRTVDLPFHVTGPTNAPVSQLTDVPPMRVTLVAGALEVTKEAIDVLDAPRKILVDLLKTAGGIVGARRSGGDNSS